MAKVTICFTLDADDDKDLTHWLDAQDNRSAAIREAIREHVGRHSVTVGDVLQAVRNLERKIKAGAVIAGESPTEGSEYTEPPDVAAALDALADL
jgi:hypothetical protein